MSWTVVCPGCHTEFTTRDPRRKRCVPGCGRDSASRNGARNRVSAAHDVRFVGVDGEGVTDPDGDHRYVLLSVGGQSLKCDRYASRLHTLEIFDFLWDCWRDDPTAAYVGFYLGYDFAQWLRDLPEDRAFALLHPQGIAARRRSRSGGNPVPFPVRYSGWEFDLHAGRRFKLRREGADGWMYICDSGPFFQSSFLTAIDPATWPEPVCSADEYATIVEGKKSRASAVLDSAMVRYNITENTVLGSLLDRLNTGLTTAGVRLRRNQWYGPGQAAAAWMKTVGGPTVSTLSTHVPPWALEAGRLSYYGGWFETFAHGPVPGISHEYDINSAYPDAIAKLPCLLHGTWARGSKVSYSSGDWTLVDATVHGSNSHIGAMLHRQPDGGILRPAHTRGWYWWDELSAARIAGLVDSIDVHSALVYSPCSCPPPYGAISTLYQRRLDVGKNTPEGRALKLLYNSCYGKMAQSVGNPTYACSLYASRITSVTRTRLLDAIGSHPGGTASVLMVATDGIYFDSPHPYLDIDDSKLGLWSSGTKENLSLFMPGIYWDNAVRHKIAAGVHSTLRSRGINSTDLAARISSIDALWSTWTPDQPWPTLDIPIRFNMVSPKQALARGKWDLCGTVATGSVRTITANPLTKRLATPPWLTQRDGRWTSAPYATGRTLESVPYDQVFGAVPDELYDSYWDITTPDGSLSDLFAQALADPGEW